MDKTELESLLVKLKLGTITVDDAIEELHSNVETGEQSVRAFFPPALKNVIYANKLLKDSVKDQIDSYTDMKKDFICVGLDAEKITYIEASIKTITVDRDANIVYSIKKSLPRLDKNVAVISSAYSCGSIAKECMKLLDIVGFEYECLTDIRVHDVKKVINYLPNIDAAVVINDGDLSIVSLIAEYTSKPIISVCENSENFNQMPRLISAAASGVLYADNLSTFSSVAALYRILGRSK